MHSTQKDCECMWGSVTEVLADIISELKKHLNKPVIRSDQDAPIPEYPYISIKDIVPFIPAQGSPVVMFDEDEEKQIATSTPTMSISVTGYSKRFDDVSELILKAHDWFSFVGYEELKEIGFVVVRTESVMNRDSLLIDDYERKRGFDVLLRFVHRQEKDANFIESVELNNEVIGE